MSFGAIDFPVELTEVGSQGDPALFYISDFLKTVINSDCLAAWDNVCAERNPVDYVVLNDPQQTFDESRLPALYLFRTSSTTTAETDDCLQDVSQLSCFWVTEPAQEEHLKQRSQMMNAVYKSAFRALVRGRDPAWLVDEDTDPYSVGRGSYLWGYAGLKRILLHDTKPATITGNRVDGDGKPMPYYALLMTLEITERTTRTWPGTFPTTGEGFTKTPPDEFNPDPMTVGQFAAVTTP